jgi:hypothetical protein
VQRLKVTAWYRRQPIERIERMKLISPIRSIRLIR